jgi:hypothetical protein
MRYDPQQLLRGAVPMALMLWLNGMMMMMKMMLMIHSRLHSSESLVGCDSTSCDSLLIWILGGQG